MSRDFPRAILGRTNLEVTRFGIGGTYCETVDGYRAALDCGVNYIDTARSYLGGEDEKVIGQAIQGRRHDLIVASKSARRDAEEARKELQTSLRALKTDYLDIFQLHHLNTEEERNQALGPGGALEAAQQAREEGLVRFIGVTGHDWVQVEQAVRTGHFDTVLCWYNCAMKEPEETVFSRCAGRQYGRGDHERLAQRAVAKRSLAHSLLNSSIATCSATTPCIPRSWVCGVSISLHELPLVCRSARRSRQQERAELEAYGAQQRAAGALE